MHRQEHNVQRTVKQLSQFGRGPETKEENEKNLERVKEKQQKKKKKEKFKSKGL